MNYEVSLGPLDSTHREVIRKWRNDFRIIEWTRQSDFISDLEQEVWFRNQASDQTIKMYSVNLRSDGKESQIIGVAGFTSIDLRNSRAEFSLYISPDLHRRGLGKIALKILFDHGFINLGFNQIYGETFDQNPAMKMFLSAGMRHDGTRRGFYFKNGKYIDAHLISITAEEHGKPRLSAQCLGNDDQPGGGSGSDGGVVVDAQTTRRQSAPAAKPRPETAEKQGEAPPDSALG